MSDYMFLIVDQVSGDSIYLTNVSGVSGGKSSTVTKYNTTTGKKISDHLYVNPRNLNFKINTSHIAMSPCKRVSANGENIEILSVTDLKNIFDEWISQGNRLNITTYEDYYTNMVLTNIATNESEGLSAWAPSLSFTEVRIASPEYIKLEFPEDNAEAAASNDEQNTGITGADFGESLGNIAGGALVGAAIGSVIPGVGTVAGAIVGGVVGFFAGIFQ